MPVGGHDRAVLTILLPPSEGKDPGGAEGTAWSPDQGRFAVLADVRRRVADALVAADGGDARLLGARGDLLDRSRDANRAVLGAPTLPAFERFTGVVWDALGPHDLPAAARRRARSSVVVVSALTGLSAWDDPVPDFRLKLSVRLDPLGRLDAFWREPLSEALNRHCRRRTVVDLLPIEHRSAWVPDPARCRLLRPELRTASGAAGGHNGKAAKGRLARALLLGTDIDEVLAAFDAGPLRLDVEEVRPG